MELALRCASCILLFLTIIVKPYFWIRNFSKSPAIPPGKNLLLNLSAVQLAKKIRDREISSETVVKAYIERIKEVNPFINAVIEDRFEAAVADAKRCDKTLTLGEITSAQLEKEMPFFGIPITVKESCSLKDLSYTGCTVVRRGLKSNSDSLAVQKMKSAGAIPLCVTNTPELCSGFESTNLIYGITRNPYDSRHSAGGSSGGEGAIVGAGASLVGIGSDIAGSIRVPSMFNGIFGHKPTPGIIPITGHFPMANDDGFKKLLVLGPMTRYAEDLHAAVKVMSAGCNHNLRLDEPVDVTKLNIIYLTDLKNNYGVKSVEHEIQNSIRQAVTHFETLGAKVNELKYPDLTEACEIGIMALFSISDLPEILMHPTNPKIKINAIKEFFKSLLGYSIYSREAIFMAVLRQVNAFIPKNKEPKYLNDLETMEKKFHTMLDDNTVFFFPTLPMPAPEIGQATLHVNGGMYCLLGNFLGLPATAVPMGLNHKGLPIGFQVIAGPHMDRLCLAVAKELEKVFGGWIPPTRSSPLS